MSIEKLLNDNYKKNRIDICEKYNLKFNETCRCCETYPCEYIIAKTEYETILRLYGDGFKIK